MQCGASKWASLSSVVVPVMFGMLTLIVPPAGDDVFNGAYGMGVALPINLATSIATSATTQEISALITISWTLM